MEQLPLYFIAIIPPEPIYSFAQQQKEYFLDKYDSKAALKSPPHVTLHMPFRIKEKKESVLIKVMKELASLHTCFEMEANGFGAFEPRVIYIDVSRPDKLVAIQRNVGRAMKEKMNLFNANYKDKVFNPHLTVAFRDLKKPMFHKAWQEFQQKRYTSTFDVDSFALLKHNKLKWEVFEHFNLKDNS